mmetsp:Transcript_40088/g.87492  ORF Transcript_40088/g.87492 Transcript_40088/m.87492 type:complete len:256 (-) Transcript_40088:88-855(-)
MDAPAMPPPAALLAFLGGEAPSEAALRRPESRGGPPPTPSPRPAGPSSSARRSKNGEDSSPDSDAAPADNGGFDDSRDIDSRAPVPVAEPVPAPAAKAPRSPRGSQREAKPQQRALPPRAPGESSTSSSGPAEPTAAYPRQGRDKADFNKTCTPGPASLGAMLGEDSAAQALRRSRSGTGRSPCASPSGGAAERPRSGSRRSSSSAGKGRPGSGEQQGERSGSGTPSRTKTAAAAALDLDPLGQSQGKRRFGGRG